MNFETRLIINLLIFDKITLTKTATIIANTLTIKETV